VTSADPVAVDTAPAAGVQRRTLAVLSSGAVLGGVAVAGSIPAGSLLTASIADSESVAGLAQTAGVVGAAIMALPLARIALSRGRRAALACGYAVGAIGAAIVIWAAATANLAGILVGCLLVARTWPRRQIAPGPYRWSSGPERSARCSARTCSGARGCSRSTSGCPSWQAPTSCVLPA